MCGVVNDLGANLQVNVDCISVQVKSRIYEKNENNKRAGQTKGLKCHCIKQRLSHTGATINRYNGIMGNADNDEKKKAIL